MEGRLIGDDHWFEGVSTDTRQLRQGELFVALRDSSSVTPSYQVLMVLSVLLALPAPHWRMLLADAEEQGNEELVAEAKYLLSQPAQ